MWVENKRFSVILLSDNVHRETNVQNMNWLESENDMLADFTVPLMSTLSNKKKNEMM